MDRRLRFAVPTIPFAVLLLILLLVEDPRKPWSGIAYVAAALTIVGFGWFAGRWITLAVPAVVFTVALFVSWREPDPHGACDPACWTAAGGYTVLALVLVTLLAIGITVRRLAARFSIDRP